MTESDRGTFERAFRRLSGAFRLKLKPTQMTELLDVYGRAFETVSLADVLAGGKTCLTTCRRFPTVAEWIAALPTPDPIATSADRVLSREEAAVLARAARLHYQDAPCACEACQHAGVTDQPLRFVPIEDETGRVARAFDPIRHQVVEVGQWIHGDALARWYAARAACRLGAASTPLARVVARLAPTRRRMAKADLPAVTERRTG